MKKTLMVTAIFLGIGMVASPSHADLVLSLGTIFSNTTSPAGSAPWATLTFADMGADTVQLTIQNQLQGATEFITELDFNSSLLTGLTITPISTIGIVTDPSLGYGVPPGTFDSYKADGDGWFDIGLGFATSGDGRFQGGETIVFTITGTGISSSTFNLTSLSGGGQGTYHAAAHVQGIATGEGSTWIGDPSPVPEPATMLLFGTGIAGLAGIARRKRS